jgi:hypothetical protein
MATRTNWKTNAQNAVATSDVALEIAKGNIVGHSCVNKFGHAHDGIQLNTPTDIWDRADSSDTQNIWVAPLQARTHTISSDSSNDDGPSGVGARNIRIFGLTDWESKEVSEDIVMDGAGTNAQVTSNAYVIIHRMFVVQSGGTDINTGTITATATTDGTVTAQINPLRGQTEMAIYGLPSIQTAYMTSYYASSAETANFVMDLSLLVNRDPVAQLTDFLTKGSMTLSNSGPSYFQHYYNPYFGIPGPAIIKMQATSSFDNTDATGGFDLILTDNEDRARAERNVGI